MLLIDIRSTNASAAEFILYRLKLYLAGRHHHHTLDYTPECNMSFRRSSLSIALLCALRMRPLD